VTTRIDWPVIVFGIIGILFVDAACESIDEFIGETNEWWTIVPNFLFYATIGFIAGWRRSAATAAYTGVAIFLPDVTLGWWIENQIGPDALDVNELPEIIAVIVVLRFVLAVSILVAYGAGALGQRVRTSREVAASAQ
jgi:hypothetical protein